MASDALQLGPARVGAAASAAEPYSRIVMYSIQAARDAKGELIREAEELEASSAVVDRWAAQQGGPAKEQWPLIGGGGVLPGSEDNGFLAIPNKMPIAKCEPKPDSFATAVVQAAEQTSAAYRAALWEDRHKLVKFKMKARPKPFQRKCHEAGVCLCCDEVARLRQKFHTRLRQAFHASGKHFEKKVFQNWLTKGDLVLHLEQELPDGAEANLALPDQGAEAPPPLGGTGELWLHVSTHYMRPWRPTFIVMRRCLALDRPGQLGLEACRCDDGDRLLLVRSVSR